MRGIDKKNKSWDKASSFFIGIFLIFFFITCFFFSFQQIYYLKKSLINEGIFLSSALAINSRVGVLTRSEKRLKEEVIGFLHQPNVVKISIFDRNGIIMSIEEKTLPRLASILEIKERIKRKESPPFIYEDRSQINIWTPIYVSSEEDIVWRIIPQEKDLAGWVELSLDKSKILRKQRYYIIFSFLLFFLLASWLCYFIRKASLKIVGPLNQICNLVSSFTKTEELHEIPVDIEHEEARKIALAFNELVKALKNQEEEKKRLEQQLLNAHRLEAIGSLSGGIAHDFNNVLSSVMGGIDMIKYCLEHGKKIKLNTIEVMLMACIKAKEMIARLMTYAKGEKTKKQVIKLNEQIILLNKIISGLIRDDIEVKLELSDKDPAVFADATALHQVFMNMVANAQDAMPMGGTLKISTDVKEISEHEAKKYDIKANPGRYAVVSIQDTGIGMNEETKKKIFEPFFTTKVMDKGTGLGLYNSYNIIKEHNGFINVISSPNKGTTFNIYLPLTEQKLAVLEKKEEDLKDLVKGSGTILVGDDDVLVRSFLKELLSEFGYEVIMATNGTEVIDKFRENMDKVDLVLMDIIMPYKHGKAVYDEIKRMKPETKILLMSGYPEYVLEEKGIFVSDLEYLKKPIRSAFLIKKIQEVMNS